MIEHSTDSDYFSFTTGAGSVTLNVNVATYGPTLAAQEELFDSNGNLIATAANASTLSQTLTDTLAAGTYYVEVASQGTITVGAGYGQDVGQFTVSGTLPLPAATAAPGTPALLASSDTGVSNSDGVTQLNNGSPAKTIQFSVPNTINGATVSVYADGVAIGSAIATGNTTIVTTDGHTILTDGSHTITAVQTSPGIRLRAVQRRGVTINTAAPLAQWLAVSPNPRSSSVNSLTLTFNEPVYGLTLAALQLSSNGGTNLLTASQTLSTSDNKTFVLSNLGGLTTAYATYTINFTGPGTGVEDLAGNVPASGATTSFVVEDPTIAIPTGLTGSRGSVVNTPIGISDDAFGLQAVDLTIDFNPALLSLSSGDITLNAGLAAQGWVIGAVNINATTGVAIISAYASGNPISVHGAQNLFNFAFHVLANAPAGTSAISIDTSGNPANSRLNEGALAITPQNGSIVVPVGVSIGGVPSSSPEGTAVSLTSTLVGQTNPATYDWHVTATNGQTIADGTTSAFSFTPLDNGSYTVTLTVHDAAGNVGNATSTFAVTNVAPTVIAPANQAGVEGMSKSFNLGSFSDPGSLDSPWTVDVDWGDGTADTVFTTSTIGSLMQSHAYAEEGADTVTVKVTDKDNGSGSATFQTTVADAPLSLAAGPTFNATEGVASATQVVATFTDTGAAEAVTDYAATINWGDGNSGPGTISYNSASGVFSVSGAHTYASEGSFTVTTTVHHDALTPDPSVTSAATVADAALAATGGFAFIATEGQTPASQVVATFTDPGGAEALSNYSATIAWGDGNSSAATITFNAVSGVFSVSGAHLYLEEGSYVVQSHDPPRDGRERHGNQRRHRRRRTAEPQPRSDL